MTPVTLLNTQGILILGREDEYWKENSHDKHNNVFSLLMLLYKRKICVGSEKGICGSPNKEEIVVDFWHHTRQL